MFRFEPGLGLVGTHRFAVEALGADRSRLTHTLACTVEPKLLPVWPLVRRQHDALLEDILDRAELAATGRVARPAHWPLSVRVVNRVEGARARAKSRLRTRDRASRPRPADKMARLSAIAVPGTLAALSALHAAWALGWRWPGGDDRAFAEHVIGYGATEPPPALATWAVAGALAGAAAIVRTTAVSAPSRWLRLATRVIAAIFLARSAISIPIDLIRGFDDIYERLDIAIYSPLSLALGAGAATAAKRPKPGATRTS